MAKVKEKDGETLQNSLVKDEYRVENQIVPARGNVQGIMRQMGENLKESGSRDSVLMTEVRLGFYDSNGRKDLAHLYPTSRSVVAVCSPSRDSFLRGEFTLGDGCTYVSHLAINTASAYCDFVRNAVEAGLIRSSNLRSVAVKTRIRNGDSKDQLGIDTEAVISSWGTTDLNEKVTYIGGEGRFTLERNWSLLNQRVSDGTLDLGNPTSITMQQPKLVLNVGEKCLTMRFGSRDMTFDPSELGEGTRELLRMKEEHLGGGGHMSFVRNGVGGFDIDDIMIPERTSDGALMLMDGLNPSPPVDGVRLQPLGWGHEELAGDTERIISEALNNRTSDGLHVLERNYGDGKPNFYINQRNHRRPVGANEPHLCLVTDGLDSIEASLVVIERSNVNLEVDYEKLFSDVFV